MAANSTDTRNSTLMPSTAAKTTFLVILYPIAKGKFRRQFNRLVTAKLSDIM
jgi:hypothetical protein